MVRILESGLLQYRGGNVVKSRVQSEGCDKKPKAISGNQTGTINTRFSSMSLP